MNESYRYDIIEKVKRPDLKMMGFRTVISAQSQSAIEKNFNYHSVKYGLQTSQWSNRDENAIKLARLNAHAMVAESFTADTFATIKKQIIRDTQKPLLVPIHGLNIDLQDPRKATPGKSFNLLPHAIATHLAQEMDLDIYPWITPSNDVKRTNLRHEEKMAFFSTFEPMANAPNLTGRSVILVDNHIGTGASAYSIATTLKSLGVHKILGAVTLGHHNHGPDEENKSWSFLQSPETSKLLKAKLNMWSSSELFEKTFGFTTDLLSEQEARIVTSLLDKTRQRNKDCCLDNVVNHLTSLRREWAVQHHHYSPAKPTGAKHAPVIRQPH